MNKQRKTVPEACKTVMTIGVVLATAASASVSAAQPGYVTDSSGTVVRDSSRDCVRTGTWTPDSVIEECGGKKKVVAQTPPPAPAPAPAPRPEVITLDAKALFGFDKATLRPEARVNLDELARRLTQTTRVLNVSITGHADRIGTTAYNQRLSEERAQAVADYLKAHTDLRESKFRVQGVGETQPVVACEKQHGSALIDCLQPNRRVVIEVSAQEPAAQP